ncbi:cystathionine beta-lyase [Aliidongia dinghuensis]|uniref:cysteine-S-conjugate beta-lyase n=1 Tax=Aliidongia dinghuensis TaxID=1867774 RepID=A0A8J2Z082_9PROT|nr:PatB family C-S lyase [Aliidongia dinghuensis]GGF43770.1 cystathionine beta-lyase [Aliidongia dinghuensis]
MVHDFDRKIDRRTTNALAIEGYQAYLFGADAPSEVREDLVSMWVADMQFAAPPSAIEAMAARLEHPIFGYTMNFDDALFNAFGAWCARRYDWVIRREEMELSLGVIPALFDLIDCACAPDEKVLTLTPAYGYFRRAADHHGREFVTSKLLRDGVDVRVDFADFEAKARDPKVRLFFLCHPHNPTGRIWGEDELRRMGEICLANDVLIVSDEIHCDLLRSGLRHVPIAKLFPGAKGIVTCMAASKTFNLAGMMMATIIIPDPDLRAIWRKRHYPLVSPMGLAAATGAYRGGGEWLDQLRLYLDENFSLLSRVLAERLPRARFRIPGATYLAWVDLSAYFPAEINLTRLFLDEAGVILEGGEMFIENGEGMVRLNLACPRAELKVALDRICTAVASKYTGSPEEPTDEPLAPLRLDRSVLDMA